jgi:CheY-like chemotaxis protein
MSKVRLLWVDDEWSQLPELLDLFSAAEIEADCARSPAEAQALMDKNHYDVVLLDMILPTRSVPTRSGIPNAAPPPFLGLDLLNRISDIPQEKRPAVVVVTIAEDDRLLERLNGWIKKRLITEVLRKGTLTHERILNAVKAALSRNLSTQIAR